MLIFGRTELYPAPQAPVKVEIHSGIPVGGASPQTCTAEQSFTRRPV